MEVHSVRGAWALVPGLMGAVVPGLTREELQKYSAGSLLKSESDELSAGVNMSSSVSSAG